MIAKFALICLASLGASMGAAQATQLGNKAQAPVAELEKGARPTRQADQPLAGAVPHTEAVLADADFPTARPERKVRVVYPLPR